MNADFADGKYTVISDNGILTALRYGEPWDRDLIGDNLVYWMLVEVANLKSQREELLEALRGILGLAEEFVSRELSDAAIGKATGGAV